MRVITILFFSMIIIGCNKTINKSELLTQHLQELMKDDYNKNGNYIIINKNGCLGCISKSVLFLNSSPKHLEAYDALVASESVIEEFPYILKLPIVQYIDSTNLLDRLNTGISGFTTVSLKANSVTRMLTSNVLITSEVEKMDSFFTLESSRSPIQSYSFIELNRPEFERKLPKLELSSNTFERSTLFFFTSDHCSPCKIIHPIIDTISQLYGDSIDFYFIKSDKNDNMRVFNDYNIIATPTILVFRNDKPMFEHIGMIKKNELIELLFDGK